MRDSLGVLRRSLPRSDDSLLGLVPVFNVSAGWAAGSLPEIERQVGNFHLLVAGCLVVSRRFFRIHRS